MPEGFAVQLDALADFKSQVSKTTTEYQQLTAQLSDADISPNYKKDKLLSNPGHSGQPAEFHTACSDMLIKYNELINGLHRVHAVITAQFEHTTAALGETHALYARLDNTHANVFQGLLDGFPSDGS